MPAITTAKAFAENSIKDSSFIENDDAGIRASYLHQLLQNYAVLIP